MIPNVVGRITLSSAMEKIVISPDEMRLINVYRDLKDSGHGQIVIRVRDGMCYLAEKTEQVKI